VRLSLSTAGPDTRGVVIDQLLKEVQIGLARVQTELQKEAIPPQESVTLNLTAEVRKTTGGKVNLFILSFGRKVERSQTQEIEVKLKPPS
jgi:protein subunit release factor A